MIPVYLKLNNFLSHTRTEIDFTKFDLALILGAYDNNFDISNGSGKSAIQESIAWAVYDKSRYKRAKNGVVKRNQKSCRVEFHFMLGEDKYRIIRIRDKTLNDSCVKFDIWRNSKFESIAEDTNTQTNKKIIKTICVEYDVFLNSVYFKQKDISAFTDSTPVKRKNILKSLIRMDKWDRYQKAADKEAKALKSQMENLNSRSVPITKINNDLEDCDKNIEIYESRIKNENKVYTELNNLLFDKKIELNSMLNDDRKKLLDGVKFEYGQARKRIAEINAALSRNEKKAQQVEDDIDATRKEIEHLSGIVKSAESVNIDKFKKSIFGARTKERMLSERAMLLKSKACSSGQCDLCGKKLSSEEVEKINIQRAAEFNDTQEKHKKIKERLVLADKKLVEMERKTKNGLDAQISLGRLVPKLDTLVTLKKSIMNETEQLVAEKNKIKERDFKKEIEKLAGNEEDVVQNLKSEIIDTENKLSNLKYEIDELIMKCGGEAKRRNDLIEQRREQEKIDKRLRRVVESYSVHNKLADAFGKNGIQSIIIENIIDDLENYANEILAKICNEPTSISINTQKVDGGGSWVETLDILVKMGAMTDELHTLSTGEAFRVALAMRIALSNILANRMGGAIKFLLLDEVSSHLDNQGKAMFVETVKALSKDMKVLLITHDESLKEKIEDVIVVNKTRNGSSATLQ